MELQGENHAVVRGERPLLITCEHASRAVPADLRDLGLPAETLDAHWGWDRWAEDVLARLAPRLAASTVASRVSRLVLDVNRAPDDPTLVVPALEGRAVPGNQGLTAAQVEARVARFHAPYHAAVDAEVARLVARHGRSTLLVSLHSFTGRWAGQDRAFDVGVLFDRFEGLAATVRDALEAQGLRVRLNEPYSGLSGLIYAARRHGERHGLRYLELELNQDVLEAPAERERFAASLEAALVSALAVDRAP